MAEIWETASNDTLVSILSCSSSWVMPWCLRTVLLSFFSIVTFFAVVAVIYRTISIAKNKITYQIAILGLALIQALSLVIAYLFISNPIAIVIIEFTKVLVLLAVIFFFLSSAIRMIGWKKPMLRYFMFPIIALFAGFLGACLLWSYFQVANDFCRDIPLLIFSITHVFLTLSFAILACVVVCILTRGAETTMSSKYKSRHKKPMATLACVYGFSVFVTTAPRVYLFIATLDPEVDCYSILDEDESAWVWVSTIYRVIDLLLPLWALLWYFIHTTKRPRRPSSLTDLYQFSDHVTEEPGSRTLSSYQFQQPFSVNSPYQSYVKRHSSSEEDGLFTDYSGEEGR